MSDPPPTPAGPEPNLPPASQTLDYWVAAVGRLDPKGATALYSPDAMVFWGTFGDFCRVTSAETLHYFERFLDVESMDCEIKEIHWRKLGADAVVAGGWYSFAAVRWGTTEPAEVKARFTFAFKRDGDGSWKIAEHHSSLFPDDGF